jgi:hypothetical protein
MEKSGNNISGRLRLDILSEWVQEWRSGEDTKGKDVNNDAGGRESTNSRAA